MSTLLTLIQQLTVKEHVSEIKPSEETEIMKYFPKKGDSNRDLLMLVGICASNFSSLS